MTLKRYKQKRDFAKTPEPSGKVKKSRSGLIFVIQRHHARRLHYDFRLEWRGTLKSWAVPKGPSLDPKDKRLAVEVEDHPIDYAEFEGEIPKGEYGAGKVFIWDNGTWESDSDVDKALRKGHLDFELHGKKLQGKWTLVRLRTDQSGKNNWLLLKRQDEFARPKSNVVEERPESVKKASPPPAFVEPQLAQLMDKAPVGPDWIHEIKFDGYRTICRIDGDDVKLLTRSGRDWTEKYGPLAEEMKRLPTTNALLDGEIAWAADSSHTDFQGLQTALMKRDFSRLVYYVFDILHLDGRDLRPLPLSERKQILENLLKGAQTPHIFYSKHWAGSGPEVYEQSCRLGLEGIVSKQADEPYSSGRSYAWQKVTCAARQEFVIGGYTESAKNRPFGALLLGVYEGKELRFVGRAGTGFSDEAMAMVAKKLFPLEQKKSPFVNPPRERDCRWVKPKLVAEVEYKTWTSGGLLRMASFQGLREDKRPEEIRKETPVHATKSSKERENEVQGITITHPDRMLYPKAKKRKIDVVRFYDAASERMMPFLEDRPLSLLRCQETAQKNCFFQKHAVGKGMHAKPVHYKDKSDTALTVASPKELIYLVQNGALEIHGWGARFAKITTPDMMVFDLDPESLDLWPLVVDTAHEIREMLLQLGLEPFVKVTGGKGIHIQVPVVPRYDWDTIKEFSRSLMEVLVRRDPSRYTTNMAKRARSGKVFLDYLRNGYGATAALPYSVRAREHPTVALPIDWKELKTSLSPSDFELDEALKRLRRKDPWKDFWEKARPISVLEEREAA